MLRLDTVKRVGQASDKPEHRLACMTGNSCEAVMFYRYFAHELIESDQRQAADFLRRAQIGEEVHIPYSPVFQERLAYAVNKCREIGIRVVVDQPIQQVLDTVSQESDDASLANYPESWDGLPENACL